MCSIRLILFAFAASCYVAEQDEACRKVCNCHQDDHKNYQRSHFVLP